MSFYKYRYNSSSSYGEWEYMETNDMCTEEDVKEDLWEKCSFSDSDHYRGFDLQKIDLPPKEWLEREIKRARRLSKVFSATASRYEKIIGEENNMKEIKFYKTKDPYGEFSSFSRHAIYVDRKIWPTSEHYFQAMKFPDEYLQEIVRTAKTPSAAAAIGRDRTLNIRELWDEDGRIHFMRVALRAKFTQHPDLYKLLLGTGDVILIEHTVNDSYWGDGGDGSGQNMLGNLLGELRAELRRLRVTGEMER